MTPEQSLFATSIVVRLSDAIQPFSIPGDEVPGIETQVADFVSGKRNLPTEIDSMERRKAIAWFEKSHFDEFAFASGYDTLFVTKTFNFIQDCLTKRKLSLMPHVPQIRKRQRMERLRRKIKSSFKAACEAKPMLVSKKPRRVIRKKRAA
jgi:hypothetical protein